MRALLGVLLLSAGIWLVVTAVYLRETPRGSWTPALARSAGEKAGGVILVLWLLGFGLYFLATGLLEG